MEAPTQLDEPVVCNSKFSSLVIRITYNNEASLLELVLAYTYLAEIISKAYHLLPKVFWSV